MNAVSGGDALPSSIRRTRRAVAARHLLALHAEARLEEPARWDWDTLGELPSWCLLGAEERRRLQCVAGLVFLGPELCRIVDGGVLRAIGEAVGVDVLERVLDDAASRFAAGVESTDEASERGGDREGDRVDSPATLVRDGLAESADEPAGRLLAIGSSVLHATLGERLARVLPLAPLRETLGEPLGALDEATAERVLATAERLLASPGGPSTAATGVRADAPGAGAISTEEAR